MDDYNISKMLLSKKYSKCEIYAKFFLQYNDGCSVKDCNCKRDFDKDINYLNTPYKHNSVSSPWSDSTVCFYNGKSFEEMQKTIYDKHKT